jgi:hypothetical protein
MGGKISKRKTKLHDEHRLGRPVSVATEAVKQQIEQGIRQLVDWWSKCVAKQGNRVEKLDTHNFYKYSCKNLIIKFLLFNDFPSYNWHT